MSNPLLKLTMWVMVAALAAISISPTTLNLLPFQGMCSGKMRVYVPAHEENRRVIIQQNDGTDAIDKSEADVPASGFSRDMIIVLYEGEHRTITAWVMGPNEKIRGTAVGAVHCGVN